jgi:hypothetical protein
MSYWGRARYDDIPTFRHEPAHDEKEAFFLTRFMGHRFTLDAEQKHALSASYLDNIAQFTSAEWDAFNKDMDGHWFRDVLYRESRAKKKTASLKSFWDDVSAMTSQYDEKDISYLVNRSKDNWQSPASVCTLLAGLDPSGFDNWLKYVGENGLSFHAARGGLENSRQWILSEMLWKRAAVFKS